jgi:S1-C subfamily serine protease
MATEELTMRRFLCVLALTALLIPVALADASCPLGFGAGIIDAEDDEGNKWGVLIQQVIPGGRAHEMGLKSNDVVVSLDGESLVAEGEDAEAPYDIFVRLLGGLECGQRATLGYVREGETLEASFSVPKAK